MRPRLAFLALALAFAGGVPAAIAQTAPAATDPAREALALDLAHLLNSREATLAQMRGMLADAMPKALLANPDVAAMEAKYPGIVRAMIAAMEPILLRYMSDAMPELWQEIAKLYAENLSSDDLRATLAFYRGPTGSRVVEVMLAELDFEPALRGAVQSGTFELSSSDFTSTVRATANHAAARLTPQELAETARFGMSPAGRRLPSLAQQVMALLDQWSSKPTPELDAELDKAVTDAVQKFIAAGQAK